MDWLNMLQDIFQVCVIPLLGVLTAYLVKFINTKSAEMSAKTDNELLKKYLGMLTETVTACVIATNQTYVDALKDKNAFDEVAQKEAFEKTFKAVKLLLTEDARVYLAEMYGDVDEFIKQLIEAQVHEEKALCVE